MSEQSGKQGAENLLNTFLETFSESIQKQNSLTFFESDRTSVSSSIKRLFGREKPVHHLLGGGKSADVLLWRNKRISISVLSSATVIWLLFEWLNYHLLTLISFALVFSMSLVFLWSNVAIVINRSPPQIPRIALPEDLFVNAAVALRLEINRFLGFLQDVSSGRDLQSFLVVAAGLWILAIVGSWCNFLTILYIDWCSGGDEGKGLKLGQSYWNTSKDAHSYHINQSHSEIGVEEWVLFKTLRITVIWALAPIKQQRGEHLDCL